MVKNEGGNKTKGQARKYANNDRKDNNDSVMGFFSSFFSKIFNIERDSCNSSKTNEHRIVTTSSSTSPSDIFTINGFISIPAASKYCSSNSRGI